MTNARIGWGGKVYLGTANTEASLVQLAEVKSATFPQDETDEHDVTHLLSPDRREEIIGGIIRGGEGTLTLNYDPGSATDLLLTAAKETGTTRKVRYVVPDESGTGAADWNFVTSCFVKKYAPDTMEPNSPITATAVLRFTGGLDQGAGAAGS